jgi:hypothetical protein
MSTRKRITKQYDDTNLLAATLLALDPERYPGVLQEWADTILSKAAQPDESEAGPLFAATGRRAAA